VELVEGFLANQAMRGLSPRTLKRRRWTLTTFLDGLEPRRSDAATTVDVERFISSRNAAATRRALLGDLRAFYRWAASRELCSSDPTAPVETPKVPKRLPTPLTTGELRRAWEAAPWDLRVVLALGSCAGLRVSEMAALHTNDIDHTNSTIVVRGGKGGKDRVIPMNQVLAGLLVHCPPGPVTRYTNGDSIGNRVRAHFRPLGINKRAHDLRATFATELNRVSGGDLPLVAALMGHESMDTTRRYVALSPAGHGVVNRLFRELPAA
jgi:integrase/recombinase XerD